MLSIYQSNMLNHLRQIEMWAAEHGASASIRLPGSVLRVEWRNRVFDFQPQFQTKTPGGSNCWYELTPNAVGFAGWLPYFNKRWNAAHRKLLFKAFAMAHGIRTPAFSTQPGRYKDVVIKRECSSFGEGVFGPYREVTSEFQPNGLKQGEYFEQFIPGRILKALYWNGRPVCVELFDMATVTGDGRHSLEELTSNPNSLATRSLSAATVEAMVAYQGLNMEQVPPAGQSICVDCRYGSPLLQIVRHNTNALSKIEPEIVAQLQSLGPVFESAIPKEIRENTAFSADGIVDSEGRVWFLEMNCNPMLHPDIYPAMFGSLFEDADVFADEYKPLHLRGAKTVSPVTPAVESKPVVAFANAAS